jgi:LmbE family N-acetylglucosaminyl deacetylase
VRLVKLPSRIRWVHVQRLYEAIAPYMKASPVKLDRPESGRVLVLSPHIDDDVIGAGGSLRKHAQNGDEVRALYFADCTDERIREAEEAASIIGIGRLEFFEYKSKTLLGRRVIQDRLAGILEEYRPEIVYVPSLFDRHNDHLAVNHFLAGSCGERRRGFSVCAYEVWSTLVPNLIVDISSSVDEKREALSQYRSQLSAHDWRDAALSLNRYRGVTSGAGEYAEAFMRYSAPEYFRIWTSVYDR